MNSAVGLLLRLRSFVQNFSTHANILPVWLYSMSQPKLRSNFRQFPALVDSDSQLFGIDSSPEIQRVACRARGITRGKDSDDRPEISCLWRCTRGVATVVSFFSRRVAIEALNESPH